jgi:hypothetical protein
MDDGSARPRQRPVAIRTLADLGERDHLYAYCHACRHNSPLDPAARSALAQQLTESAALLEVRRVRRAGV